MIKAVMANEDGTKKIVLLGLEEGNLRKLREGRPLHIFGKEMGIGHDIIVVYGKDAKALTDLIRPYIGDDTVVRNLTEEKKQ